MCRNRNEAALQLAGRLKGRLFCDPLVLAIPGGGLREDLCAHALEKG
jgi:hypothetical protein